ncbi:peptidoglycan DD-metalloendopeptidase family protein [Fodinicurvata sp. EGI_FJ10296]|uniref:murein hydrolase activator EnvC family protein n=1 Tax=Fodinicurvata sp. EGI_FJ10296 TaxID=3231908 RepID=UPI003452E147
MFGSGPPEAPRGPLRGRARSAGAAALALALVTGFTSLAADGARERSPDAVGEAGSGQTEIGATERAASAVHDRLDALQAAIDAISDRRDDLDRDLSDTLADLGRTLDDANAAATALDELDARQNATEHRIRSLMTRESALRRTLRDNTDSIAHLTSPMLAAARAPVRLTVTAAADPLAAARSTIVARRVMSGIDGDIAVLRTEIDDLTRLGAQLHDERASLTEDSLRVADRLSELEAAIAEKRNTVSTLIDARATETGRLDSLSALTTTLQTALQDLETETRRLRTAHRQRRPVAEPEISGLDVPGYVQDTAPSGTGSPETGAEAGADSRPEDAQSEQRREFAAAGLSVPASGRILAAFGEPDRFGDPLPGIRFSVDDTSAIVAPLAGTVRFAGEFGGYGRLLILEHGDGYHSLIAGFGEITVAPGDVVTREAVLGQPPSPQNGQTQPPEIYFEVRQNGRPVAPLQGLIRAQERGRG